ncbi:MAG TPA: glycosyltransferase family 39 protein, partial [Thermoanaerobaculia bacterium]
MAAGGESPIRNIRERLARRSKISDGASNPDRLVSTEFLLGSLVILLLGASVRAVYAFPIHKFAADADSLNMALRALAIRGGDLVVFFSGYQIGAFEAYLHAAAFAFLGPSRETVSLAPLVAGCLVLVVFFQFLRELFSTEVAFLALPFMALPSPAYLAWTYMPNSYPETVLFCVTTLWLAARAARRGGGEWAGFAIGVSAGLGWWNSALTLSCTLPALAWLLLFRRERVSRRRLALGVLAGFAVGAAPWILFNLRYGMPTLRQNFAAAPASASVLATARRLLTKTVP